MTLPLRARPRYTRFWKPPGHEGRVRLVGQRLQRRLLPTVVRRPTLPGRFLVRTIRQIAALWDRGGSE